MKKTTEEKPIEQRVAETTAKIVSERPSWPVGASPALTEANNFIFSTLTGTSAKSIDMSLALQFWELLLLLPSGQDRFPLSSKWLAFIRHKISKKASKKKVTVSAGTWKEVLGFLATMDADMTRYSAEDSWPVLVDAFVEFLQKIQD